MDRKSQPGDKLTEQEIYFAFEEFERPQIVILADQSLENNRDVSLRMARTALQVSTGEMARRLEITRSGYVQMEMRAEAEVVSLKSLKKAASVLGCDLLVQFRPKRGMNFSQIIWNALFPAAKKDKRLGFVRRRTNVLKSRMLDLFVSGKFRQRQGWNRSMRVQRRRR